MTTDHKIAISGASGQIGQLILAALEDSGVKPSNIILTTTNIDKLSKEANKGMQVFQANYSDISSLETAYSDAYSVMIISGTETGKRIQQHENAVKAAEKVGVKHVVYTSVSGCHPMNRTPSAEEHYATEEMIKKSNISYTILRNHMYGEYVTTMFESSLRSGRFYFTGEDGLVNPVSRLDIAASAAAILREPEKHKNVIYEITGSELLSVKTLLNWFEEIYDKKIDYISLTAEELYSRFDARGVPRRGDPSLPIPGKFGSKELVENFVAIDELYHSALTSSVKIITGRDPKLAKECMLEDKEAVLARLQKHK